MTNGADNTTHQGLIIIHKRVCNLVSTAGQYTYMPELWVVLKCRSGIEIKAGLLKSGN
jgi:hypothetical protein